MIKMWVWLNIYAIFIDLDSFSLETLLEDVDVLSLGMKRVG